MVGTGSGGWVEGWGVTVRKPPVNDPVMWDQTVARTAARAGGRLMGRRGVTGLQGQGADSG